MVYVILWGEGLLNHVINVLRENSEVGFLRVWMTGLDSGWETVREDSPEGWTRMRRSRGLLAGKMLLQKHEKEILCSEVAE